MTEKKILRISCPAETAYLSAIRAFVSEIAKCMGFSMDDLGKIEVCVDEACTNVVEHAYKEEALLGSPSCGQTEIDVALHIDEEMLTIEVRDQGVGSNAGFENTIDNIEDYRKKYVPSGLGLYIINNLMDEVNISHPSSSGTLLSMTKYLLRELENA